MKKRKFLAALSVIVASICFWRSRIVKHYVTKVREPDLIGLKIEWGECDVTPNPHTGYDWEIVSQCPHPVFYKGEWVLNYRMNKFFAKPVGINSEPLMICVSFDSDGFADLSPMRGIRYYTT